MKKFGGQSPEVFSQAALRAVVAAVRNANTLPAPGDDFAFYSSYGGFRHFCQRQGSHIKELIGGLLQQQGINSTWMSHGAASAGDCEDQLEGLVEANDAILERVGIMLDEASGVRHAEPVQSSLSASVSALSPVVASWNKGRVAGPTTPQGSTKLIYARNTVRPQLTFKDPVDNSSAPFVPKLLAKPNAIVPLSQFSMGESTDGAAASSAVEMLLTSVRRGQSFEPSLHPYEPELMRWEPGTDQLETVKEQLYGTLAETPLTFVNTTEQLEDLCAKLGAVSEFAIDLEAHSYRTFQGFTCLMQISTRTEDFIVDTLKLRSELVMLNEVFTDPTIVKVLHGSDSDVVWLQRDHNLYLVNMFDTGQASRVLEMPRFGLAYLLQFYCSVIADKKYQLADWRIRPLPEELIKYAREDTHYLLYIYDRMRNALAERSNQNANLLNAVWTKSRDLCLRRYEKPAMKDNAYLLLHERQKKKFNAPQMEALRLLYSWRFNTARREDESIGFVLPNEMMFQIAQNMPREVQGIMACCNPVPLLVRQNVQEIYQLLSRARLLPTNAPLPTLSAEDVPFYRKPAESTPSTPAERGHPASSLPTPSAKPQHAKKSGEEMPVREFADGFAITGPPVPIAKPVLAILATVPHKVSRRSLLTSAELEAVKKFAAETPATSACPTSPTTPSASTANSSTAADASGSPVLARSEGTKAGESMNLGKDRTDGGAEEAMDDDDHPHWGSAKPKASPVTGPAATAVNMPPSAASDAETKPLRSLLPSKGGVKRRHNDKEEARANDTAGSRATAASAGEGTEADVKFEPFDYETVHQEADKAMAGRKKSTDTFGSGSAGQAKKRAVNPMKDTSSIKAPRKSKVHVKSGERSKTFSDQKSSRSVQWPKR